MACEATQGCLPSQDAPAYPPVVAGDEEDSAPSSETAEILEEVSPEPREQVEEEYDEMELDEVNWEDGPMIRELNVETSYCVALAEDEHLCIEQTAWHRAFGAYNSSATVVHVVGDELRPAPFARKQYWEVPLEGRDEREGWDRAVEGDPGFRVQDGRIELETGMRYRAQGDQGYWKTYEWRDGRFVATEIRRREGGPHVIDSTGPIPIIEPPNRRCRAVLHVSKGSRRARLTLHQGRREAVQHFRLEDDGCEDYAPESLLCGGSEDLAERVEYALVSREDDWVVLRIDGDDAHTNVFRVNRGCAL